MSRPVILNGALLPEGEATVPVSDLGLRRGFAAFEFLRVVGGTPLFLDDHMARLVRTRARLGLAGRWSEGDVREAVARLVDASAMGDGGIQIVITGGNSSDAFTPGAPTLIATPVSLSPPPASDYAQGVAVITHRNVREIPEAKTTDYLVAVTLIPRMAEAGAAEALFHDGERVLEGARSGLALVTAAGVLVTAAAGVLDSVTRRNLLPLARRAMPVEVRDIPLTELSEVAEALLLSTTRGVMPITRIDGRPVGDGRVGPHARALRDAYERHVGDHLAAARAGRTRR
ncbi:MAG: aminotransferase class IV [Thermoleophilia bacterium]